MHRSRRLAAIALLACAALGSAACSGDDDAGDAGDTTAADVTTTSSSGSDASTTTTGGGSGPTPTEPATTLADSGTSGRSELEDGRHFGYWKTFEVGDTTAFGEFDLAYFLTGDAAEKAAKAKGEEVTDGYFIVNDNPKLRTLVVDGKAKVTVLAGNGGGPDTRSTNVADFAVDRDPNHACWVTIADGKVTEIEEQYQP